MNLSIIDRPIAFQRSFVRLGIGITGSLLLSQLVYWHNRTSGWFYKTQSEINDETGLTRTEQETARKKLVKLGVLEERLCGVPAKLHFRINEPLLMDLLGKLDCGNATNKNAETLQSSLQESCKQECRKPANSDAGIRQTNTENTQEITTETTTDIKKINKKDFDFSSLSSPIEKNILDDFIGYRKSIKKPLTQSAINHLVREINKAIAAGHDPNEIMEMTLSRGWQSFSFSYLNNPKNNIGSMGDKPKYMTLSERNRQVLESMRG